MHRTMPTTSSILALALLLSAGTLSGCGGIRLESRHRDRPITVDGKTDEWRDSLEVVKDAGISVGLVNDEQDLYVCITSWNQDVNLQARNLGFTIWFDPGGGDAKVFGIEYPLIEDRIQSRGPAAPGDVVPLPELASGPSNRLAVRGPGPDDRRTMAAPDAPGLEVATATVNGSFVYELKVPLRRSGAHPYAIGADPGRVIGVLLETTRPPRYKEERPEEGRAIGAPPGAGRGGGMGGGTRGGTGGGMGGHRRGGGGGGPRGASAGPGASNPGSLRMPKPLQVSARVRLAPSAPSSGE